MINELFAREGLAQIPKLLTLLDRNPHSPTYGCFDRNFWQYKIIDFPSGMAQEFCWPLALAYHADLSFNPFYRKQAIADWCRSAVQFGIKSAHLDGSCDDYFPFERAGGAAAFSLLAFIESYRLMEWNDPAMLQFFERRADWLAGHHESGRLTNHHALIILCLELLGRMLKTSKWADAIHSRLERILGWQNEEGWFPEYEGCDPGYHTLTVTCLARLYELRPSSKLKTAIEKAVKLSANFIHPDGSYAGEYGSRNTYNFFPYGFELAGKWFPEALAVNDAFLAGMANGLAPCYSDDHIIGHHTWNYLLAWQEAVPVRPATSPRPQGRVWLPLAGILIDRRGEEELYVAVNKGGVFKLFRGKKLVVSDTQVSLRIRSGRSLRNAVGHLMGQYAFEMSEEGVVIEGDLGWAKQKQMTPFQLIVLRCVMLTVGRFCSDLIRKLLQKILITGADATPFKFRRKLEWAQGASGWQLKVCDRVTGRAWDKVTQVGIGPDQTSTYNVMSRVYQPGQMQPWLDLTSRVAGLAEGETLELDRCF
jgi:hypothetical protein